MSGYLPDTLSFTSLVELEERFTLTSLWQNESYNLISFHQEDYEALFPQTYFSIGLIDNEI